MSEADQTTALDPIEPIEPSEQVDASTERVLDPNQAQAASDLSAGFNKVRGKAEDEPVPDQPPAEKPGMSDDELRALVAKMPELDAFRGQTAQEMQRLHGKLGEFNRTLQALQQAPSAANSEAVKAARQKLTDEYPELAETILPLIGSGGGGGVTSEQLEALRSETRQQTAAFLLSQAHPDWQTVRATDAYKAWLPTLKEAERAEFLSTWDPGLVSARLSEFKQWRSDTFAKKHEKQTRLTQAIPPTGVPGRAGQKLPDSAGLSVGFNRVRGSGRIVT